MKAITYTQYGPPDVLKLSEVDTPSPGDNDVRIRIRAAAVTAADCVAREGRPFIARVAFGLFKPRMDVLGTEFAGEIESIGKDVTRFKVGDEVFAASGVGFGAHAEYICLPETGALAPIPANATFEEAAALCEGMLTALPFLRDNARLHSGQRILINGASGSVGTAAVQLAKYYGAEVTGVCSTANLDLVRSLGADKVIDYTQEDFTRCGKKFDVVFDAVGKSSFSRCKGLLKQGGIYMTTVLSARIVFQMARTSMFGQQKAIIALTGLRPPQKKANDLLLIKQLAEEGIIRAVMDRLYPLEQTADAHRYVDTGHKKGNVVIRMDANPQAG